MAVQSRPEALEGKAAASEGPRRTRLDNVEGPKRGENDAGGPFGKAQARLFQHPAKFAG